MVASHLKKKAKRMERNSIDVKKLLHEFTRLLTNDALMTADWKGTIDLAKYPSIAELIQSLGDELERAV